MHSSTNGWFRSMQSLRREHGFEPVRVEGTIPPELHGTYYRNGPGRFESFDRRYGHWFDGDGAVSAVRFEGGEAKAAVRVLETPGLREERERGKPYFGSYGTKAPGLFNPVRSFRLARGTGRNPSNTSVLAWNDRLFALCEIGRPFEVDPRELASVGETNFDGAIPRAFSAHPHRIAKSGYAFNIGVQVGHPNAIDLFVLRPDGSAGRLGQIPIALPTMIHDFAATERHLVIFLAPLRLKLLPTLLNLRAFDENLAWEPARGTEVIVVPLDAPGSPIRFHVDPFWAWHGANAFERGSEIVLDLVRHDDFPTSSAALRAMSRGLPYDGPITGRLERAVIDPIARTLRFDPWTDRRGELPRVARAVEGGRHRFVTWLEYSSLEVARHGPSDTITCLDTETGKTTSFTFENGQKPSEAVFAPRPGSPVEDDGWLLTLVYDPASHASHWAVLDARTLADGPVATAHMDHHVPPTFHGTWVAA
jgi:all-trans-8'-apo-beta-carotenal 15,15'-oxygenase